MDSITLLIMSEQLIIIPKKPSLIMMEQSINHVMMLKQFVTSVKPVHDSLTGSNSAMLQNIRKVAMHVI
jgi:DNA mismatch repair protein MSH4